MSDFLQSEVMGRFHVHKTSKATYLWMQKKKNDLKECFASRKCTLKMVSHPMFNSNSMSFDLLKFWTWEKCL